MAESIVQLHNAARVFCTERIAFWHRRYRELTDAGRQRVCLGGGKWDYSEEAWGVFPRYQILAAIQRDVELYTPAEFGTLEALRAMLIEAGETAQIAMTKFDRPISIRAIAEERQQFLDYIQSADEHALAAVPRLPFRRVLGESEHKALHERFRSKFGLWYGGYCDMAHTPVNVVTLHEAAMETPGACEEIRRMLVERGITRLLELREWGDGCEQDVTAAEFSYNGAEGFWTSGDMSWMVYASHESSISFGGDWLVAGMRRFLPDFDYYIYRGWDFSKYDQPSA